MFRIIIRILIILNTETNLIIEIEMFTLKLYLYLNNDRIIFRKNQHWLFYIPFI